MANEISVQITFDPRTGEFESKLSKLEKTAAKAGSDAGDKFADKFNKEASSIDGKKIFSSVLSASGSAVVAIAAVGAAAAAMAATVIKSTTAAFASLEKIEVGFRTLTGSAEKANKLIGELQDIAAKTPFQLEDIARASQQLLSFGFVASEIKDRIKDIGEVAAGANTAIAEMALIYGQVSAAGRLTGERLQQLQERAVPITAALAKTLNVAEHEVRGLVATGRVGFADFEKAFRSLSQEGGLFKDAMVSQSLTINGTLSTLSDNFFNLRAEIGKIFAPSIIEAARTFTDIFQQFTNAIKGDIPAFTKLFSEIAKFLVITPSKFWFDLFGGGAATNIDQLNLEIDALNNHIDDLNVKLKREEDLLKGQVFRPWTDSAGELRTEIAEGIIRLNELRESRDLILSTVPQGVDPITMLGLPTPEALGQVLETFTGIKNAFAEFQMLTFQPGGDQAPAEQAAVNGLASMAESISNSQLAFESANVAIGVSFGQTAQQVLATSKAISQTIKNSLVGGIAGGVQLMTENLMKGKGLFDDFGKFVLGVLGDMAIQIGTTTIAAGFTIQALSGLQGAQAVIAGAALVAIGTVLKSLSGGKGSIGAAPSAPSAPGGGGGNDVQIAGPEETEQKEQKVVNVTFAGPIFDSEQTGKTIVDLINKEVRDNNAVLVQPRFV